MRVYLDNSATTPLHPEVLEFMCEFNKNHFGNASSLHYIGLEAKDYLENSRKKIAEMINAEPEEIYFTSGGTEADNLCILGILKSTLRKRIITSSIEHEAVLETFMHLKDEGYEVIILDVDENGVIDLDMLEESVNKDTALISVMFANNEIGTIQPLEKICEIASKFDIPVHTDAVQAMGKIKIDVRELGINALSASAHKFFGPKGVGFVFIEKATKIENIVYGGGHEKGLRSGTENVPGIATMEKALEICIDEMVEHNRKYDLLSSQIKKCLEKIEDYKLNGHPVKRIPGTMSISFKNINGEALMEMLSLKGIAISTASACHSHSEGESVSHVLKSIGLSDEYIYGTIRITMGIENTEEEIKYFTDTLEECVRTLRGLNYSDW